MILKYLVMKNLVILLLKQIFMKKENIKEFTTEPSSLERTTEPSTTEKLTTL